MNAGNSWIKNPLNDLFFFSFGWLLILSAYLWVDQTAYKNSGRGLILGLVLLVTVVHRHLTFLLVYGDSEQFQRRKRSYVALPLCFAVVTVVSLLYLRPPSLISQAVAEPVRVHAADSLKFRVVQGSAMQSLKVDFKGSEKTLDDLAATFRERLGEKFAVAPQGESLKFTLLNPTRHSSFSIGFPRKNSQLAEQLGLASVQNYKPIRATMPLFVVLVVVSALWNFYHTLMQKMGILRIYSRKAAYGKSWLDKAMIWVWFAFLFFQMGSMPSVLEQVNRHGNSGRYLVETLRPVFKIFPYLAVASLVVALGVTVLYLVEEFRNRERTHWPKNIFMLSIMMLYGLFFYDFFIAYVVFGFSHAIEYLAFVNIFSRRKFLPKPATSSWVARWVRHQWLYMSLFALAMILLFVPWRYISNVTLGWYILGSSFLHFLYDGWIWKVRDPAVGKPLGIGYPTSTPAPAAAG